jgi:hypothetical protein
MDIDDERDVYEQFLEQLTLPREEFLARRFTLVRGEAREVAPYQAPKLELLVNADRKLFEAVIANDLRRVSTWLERGANPNARAPEGWTPLFEAVMPPSKEPAIAELLLAKGADVRVRDKNGQTPLHAAAKFGDEAHLHVLLDRGGAEIDARDPGRRTPLHVAADLGRVEAVTFLVSRGADVSLRDHADRTPRDYVRDDHARGYLSKDLWQSLERLLGGFMTARVVEARPDSLIMRVETIHSKYPEAERRATERGTLIVPCGVFREAPAVGVLVRCEKGLSPSLDEAWREARRKVELGIERER